MNITPYKNIVILRPSRGECEHDGFVYWNGEQFYCKRCYTVLDETPDYFTDEDIEYLKNNPQ